MACTLPGGAAGCKWPAWGEKSEKQLRNRVNLDDEANSMLSRPQRAP
jgi:hypothetical protein